jgi:hypothetical protein
MSYRRRRWARVGVAGLVLGAAGCGGGQGREATASAEGTGADSSAGATGTSNDPGVTVTSATSSADGTSEGSATTGTVFDVGVGEETAGTGEPVDICKVGEDGSGVDSFSPELQWSWAGDGSFNDSIVTPLVANLTDDNGDGEIDLCDIPDVLVTVNDGSCNDAHLYLLDGGTGSLHYEIEGFAVARASTPAIGDIDGDGLPEIVAQTGSANNCSGTTVSAFEHDGTPKWTSAGLAMSGEHAIALADLDNDGDVEILIHNLILDHDGLLVHALNDVDGQYWTSTTAADLDDDGDLEVVMGRSAWHHDGTVAYDASPIAPGHPAVGDLDDDDRPEIIVIQASGFAMLEHDGTVKIAPNNPTGDADWRRPATIHDLDGDDQPEFAVSSSNHYTSFEGDSAINWSAPVADLSGLASGTAFDFLGDGVAEAIYGDETNLWVFDGLTGDVQLQAPRGSITIIEYPVVVDVDNDGSSEIIVVTNHNDAHPVVQVYRDAEDRWIQARRIWNQHTYHVTNVREDATIPEFEAPHWKSLNTFRTNAQIEGGSVCEPEG